MASSSTNNSNIKLKPRLCNCGRTAAIYITETPNCNYFKFVDEDDEDVTSTIRSNTRASNGVTVEDFNELRRRLYDVENEHDDYGRRLRMVENILKAMVYLIVFSILLYFMI
ncbi:uncharacterized protein LOC114305871 isoform X2 [Camellia sinensis]|uniref:uncharacterized protein LOC114305871 isoform X2 n=1 Tax=Camellia sinensis TaxID=4442 RepID=UPI0010360685|nr:uncharacterized protein LOC114305871 isoform X2 [Camellia sinensis]